MKGRIFAFVFGVAVAAGFAWVYVKFLQGPRVIDAIYQAEIATGIYFIDRHPVLQYSYQNTGASWMPAEGEEFSGIIELSNPIDLYACAAVAKKLQYRSLPYIGSDSVLTTLSLPCFDGYRNPVTFDSLGGKKGYYRIQITEREKKIAYLDLNCGILFYYYKRSEYSYKGSLK